MFCLKLGSCRLRRRYQLINHRWQASTFNLSKTLFNQWLNSRDLSLNLNNLTMWSGCMENLEMIWDSAQMWSTTTQTRHSCGWKMAGETHNWSILLLRSTTSGFLNRRRVRNLGLLHLLALSTVGRSLSRLLTYKWSSLCAWLSSSETKQTMASLILVKVRKYWKALTIHTVSMVRWLHSCCSSKMGRLITCRQATTLRERSSISWEITRKKHAGLNRSEGRATQSTSSLNTRARM